MNWLEGLAQVSREIQQRERMLALKQQLKPFPSPAERTQTVVGGRISRDPVNRQAAMIVSKDNNWLHHFDGPVKREEPTTHRKKKTMSKGEMELVPVDSKNVPGFGGEVIELGGYQIKGKRINGELLFNIADMKDIILQMASELPDQTEKAIMPRAKEAKRAITEMMDSLAIEMGQFRNHTTKEFVEEIRQTRFATVAEISLMIKPLRELRQFFLGSDYATEINRLREFVELCERLVAIKQNGVLDAIADTMLKLAVYESGPAKG
jgi:hypothetical protein